MEPAVLHGILSSYSMQEIRVRVTTNAKKDSVTKKEEGVFEVTVRDAAQQNAANDKVLQLIAGAMGKTLKQVRIVSGHHASSKRIAIF